MSTATYEKIQRIELTSGASSITFSSIPQTYTDLCLVISSTMSTQNYIFVDVNGSGANHTYRNLIDELGTVRTYNQTAYSPPAFPIAPMFSSDATIPSSATVYFTNYTASTNKSVSANSVSEANSTTNVILGILSGMWNSTAAITSLVLYPQAGTIAAGTSATLYGIKDAATMSKATGGVLSLANGYWVHTFTSSGTFTPKQNLANVEYLVIAGGGAGGGNGGGGGGAGGYRCSVVGENSGGGAAAEARLNLTAGTDYTVTIGAGGAQGNNNPSFPGNDSTFGSITATGGGGGGWGGINATAGANGGSGGGGSSYNVYSPRSGGLGTSGQGYAGGNSSSNSTYFASGGGGGAGGAGAAVINSAAGGVGGAGVASAINGASTVRASGGSGYQQDTATAGGGAAQGLNGAANTGGGGGGNTGGGGSGIVIIRYPA